MPLLAQLTQHPLATLKSARRQATQIRTTILVGRIVRGTSATTGATTSPKARDAVALTLVDVGEGVDEGVEEAKAVGEARAKAKDEAELPLETKIELLKFDISILHSIPTNAQPS